MYVTPKDDCPDVDVTKYLDLEKFKEIDFLQKTCHDCAEKAENWICLTCGEFFCSRYVNSHFLTHHLENENHSVCLSLMDLSFWCYKCDCYIVDKSLNKYYKIISDFKFGNNFLPDVQNVSTALEYLQIDTAKATNIKYWNMVELLKAGKYSKISVMTGAGISTTAGIPDFRSSENGLFKQMQTKYGLDSPEKFFEISFFKQQPELFYEFAREFDVAKYNATPTHWFISFLHHKELLNLVFTQNIDTLEYKAKIPKEKMVFAHGNLLDGHCSGCYKDCDFGELQNHIKEGKILYCQDPECKSPCKPKVVFYGEGLPKDFFQKQDQFKESDLGIVMGTSLKVMPFNLLPYQLKKESWRLVVNREKVGKENNSDGFQYNDVSSKDIFLEGTTDDIVLKLLDDCGWRAEFDEFVEKCKCE